MRKLVLACLILLPLGCQGYHEEASLNGLTTSDWVQVLQEDEDVEKRRTAAIVLGDFGTPEADLTVKPLATAVEKDADIGVRLNALKAIAKLGPKGRKAQGAVARALNDPHKVVQKEAMKTFKVLEMSKPSALN